VELLWVKRSAGGVSKAANTVFLGFRHMFAAHFLEPTGGLLGALETELAGAEYFVDIHLSVAYGHNVCLGIEGLQHRDQALYCGLVHQIGFTDQDDVGEFHLIHQQVSHAALVFFAQVLARFLQVFGLVVIGKKVHCIDHRNHGVEGGYI